LVQKLLTYQLSSTKEILIGTTSSGIVYQLRDIYRCCWNVATYKRKVHNGKMEIVNGSMYDHVGKVENKYLGE
jgi:hypothetical protein